MRHRDATTVEGARLSSATLRRIWTFARPYRAMIALFLVVILTAALLAIVPPLVVRAILDTAIPDGDRVLIWWLAAAAVGAALGDALLQIVQRWCSSRVGEGLIYDLRGALFAKVQRMPVAFFTRTPTGAITSRLDNDVVGAQTAVTSTLGSVVSNIIVLITTLVAMIALEWRLTLLALAVLPLFVLPARRVGRRLADISREQMQHNAAMSTQMTERFNVSGAVLVKLFGNHEREDRSFRAKAAGVRDTGIRAAMYGRVFFVALGMVGAVGAAAIYGIGAQLVVTGDLTAGTLVALAALVTRVYQPLTGLTNARVDLMTSMVSFERVFEVLDAPEPIRERPGAIDLVAPAGRVTFDDVRFRYPPAVETAVASLEQHAPEADPDRDVLVGVSLDVRAGETVALVGASGAGKSTMMSLLARLYDVTAGVLRIDGHDVRDLTLASLRGAIGVVSQDPHLFHESIGDNLRYARPGATVAELADACRAARILDTIEALPDGFDTVVGERGYRLSGGEKQRLAIARLLLKDPAVMILDEATSHLDNDNEAHVQAALDEALAGRTALVIAHRLSTIRQADRIAVLDAGRIVEVGTHDELLAVDGYYAAQLRAGRHSPSSGGGDGDVDGDVVGARDDAAAVSIIALDAEALARRAVAGGAGS
ncbi:MAG: ABC transporter ATP-binding protein [Acidimicrobiia bacterium]|nr:ABC transporter ATP-binding protein [Acidimicrobiia bacterium]